MESNQICFTKDLSQWRLITGNREINRVKVDEIKKSIEAEGFHPYEPIIIRPSDNGIADGQHRYLAAKELLESGVDVTVYYLTTELDLDHIRSMNSGRRNWDINEYVKSYSISGNENYQRYNRLINKYESTFNNTVIQCACFGAKSTKLKPGHDGNRNANPKNIRNGTLVFTEEMQERASATLDELKNYLDIDTKQKTRFFQALIAVLSLSAIDKKELYQKLHFPIGNMHPDLKTMLDNAFNVPLMIEAIDKAYNMRKTTNRVFIKELWLKECKYHNCN